MGWRLARFTCRDRMFRGLCVWVDDAPPVKMATRSIIPLRKTVREKEVYETCIRTNRLHHKEYGYFLVRKEEVELLNVWREEVIKTNFRNWRHISRKEWNQIVAHERGKHEVQALRDGDGVAGFRDLLSLHLSEYRRLQAKTLEHVAKGGK